MTRFDFEIEPTRSMDGEPSGYGFKTVDNGNFVILRVATIWEESDNFDMFIKEIIKIGLLEFICLQTSEPTGNTKIIEDGIGIEVDALCEKNNPLPDLFSSIFRIHCPCEPIAEKMLDE